MRFSGGNNVGLTKMFHAISKPEHDFIAVFSFDSRT